MTQTTDRQQRHDEDAAGRSVVRAPDAVAPSEPRWRPLLGAARRAARTDILAALGVLVAWLWPACVVVAGGSDAATTGPLGFVTAAVVTTVLLVGLRLRDRATEVRADLASPEAFPVGTPLRAFTGRVSAALVPAVLVLAAFALAGWWAATEDLSRGLEVAVAVLVVACPGALALAAPTALLVGTRRAAQLGIRISGAHVVDRARRIDTIVLDKTGTVTTGEMTLVDIATAGRFPKHQALRAAAAVERGSDHPVARAVVTAAAGRAIAVPPTTDAEVLPGAGARARIKGTEVTVGRADLFDEVPAELARPTVDGTTVWLGWDGVAHASLTVADTLRRSSQRAVRDLEDAGLPTYLLTGDHDRAALTVARDVGIPVGRVLADVRPEDKPSVVADLQRRGKVVAMVGHGVDDAGALAQADLGIAMGSPATTGAGPAASGSGDLSADIVVERDELPAVVDAIELSRATRRTLRQNVGWALAHNLVAVPLATAGLVHPIVAAAATTASSLLVVTNSRRLRRWSRHG